METEQTAWRDGASRDNNLHLLRLVLAIVVLCSHSYPILYGEKLSPMREPIARLTGGQTNGGNLAVAGFFILSGFLISQSWSRGRGFIDFLRKRIRRIYPGFVVASLFSVLIVPLLAGLGWDAVRSTDPLITVSRFFLLHEPRVAGIFVSAPHPTHVNGSLWTIQYEFWCYLLVAALGLVGLLRRKWVMALLLSGAIGVYALQMERVVDPDRYFSPLLVILMGTAHVYPRLLASFLAGATFYAFRERIPRSPWLLAAAVLILGVTAITGGLVFSMHICGAYILLYTGLARPHRFVRLNTSVDLSYGIYLYAFPVQQLLVQWLGQYLNAVTLSLLALIIVVPLAWLSWHLVERRFLGPARPTLLRGGLQNRVPDRLGEVA